MKILENLNATKYVEKAGFSMAELNEMEHLCNSLGHLDSLLTYGKNSSYATDKSSRVEVYRMILAATIYRIFRVRAVLYAVVTSDAVRVHKEHIDVVQGDEARMDIRVMAFSSLN
uniref:Uncharacterized protein n=1 Tax=Solanum lycopersicum TaxID=4081 RepID=A0A3Q7FRV0_SOLLC